MNFRDYGYQPAIAVMALTELFLPETRLEAMVRKDSPNSIELCLDYRKNPIDFSVADKHNIDREHFKVLVQEFDNVMYDITQIAVTNFQPKFNIKWRNLPLSQQILDAITVELQVIVSSIFETLGLNLFNPIISGSDYGIKLL